MYSRSNEQSERNEASVCSEDSIDAENNSTSDNARKRTIRASEKKFACKYCGKKYFAENRLKRHFDMHGNSLLRHYELIFKLSIQLDPFQNISFFEYSNLGPDFDMVHKCDVCPIYFKTTAERADHKLVTHKVRLTCKICDKYFRTVKTLDSHKAAHHSGRDRRKKLSRGDEYDACDDDAGILSASGSITKKRKLQDDKQQPFECDYCDKRFSSPEGLYRHKLFHGNTYF